MFNLSLLNQLQSKFTFERTQVSLSTDSRKYNKEEVFFCLYGDNFDGFNFCESVILSGCKIVIFRDAQENLKTLKTLVEKYPKVQFIPCNDPIDFLQELAKLRIDEFKRESNLVIGITGSNGKTTTKEMLHHLLSSIHGEEVFCTQGNLNNHIGVPLTILSAPEKCKVLIVEMGANHYGEISALCKIAQPEAGLITSIGAAHIGLFGDVETIYKEKTSLYKYVESNSTARSKFIVSDEDKYLTRLSETEVLKKFGSSGKVEFNISKASNGWIVENGQNSFCINNPTILEIYNQQNLVLSFLLSFCLYPEKIEQLLDSVKTFEMPSLNRSEWISKNDKTFFLDAYNANPTSMEFSIKSFVENLELKGIELSSVHFILGDMNELGSYTEQEHMKIATILEGLGVKSASFIGKFSGFYQKGMACGKSYETKEGFNDAWPELLKQHKAFFIKGSRSLQLESIIDIT
ncbi:UDP-N-acetylmuramoyl-tripeptide--D-alanyl-D-alanine ligase [Halobacteriovorax sp. HLS]|uniref:UDP-N-acetylmuramoyl-tripeptide--D-alanyl-D- alanine ligase n=1 Tax=Halobacteriovorax sp. HLS TaxID=2234000 RepID=UPI000FD830D8|nr:UDP-N-acetylmuramoyl-tripeptide--D-alanyl-D-alanine ligase [Halobacteriovorax sp. HLS]